MTDLTTGTVLGGRPGSGAHRVVALCGPYLSGKTSLLESILYATGAIGRRGSTRAGTSIGDASAEARKRGMGTEINIASIDYLGDQWTFVDTPGSIELQHDALAALAVADAAVLVCEPSPERVVALTPLLRYIEDNLIPHLFFVNKIDSAEGRVRDMLAALQTVSSRKLVLRQVPIRRTTANGGEETVGYVDLVSERAYRYKSSGASDLIEMPAEILPRESEARREMLETLSEFDDTLLEQLIEDVAPEKSLIYRDLHDEFGAQKIAPVLLGAGDRENGVRRLLKALRHDTPFVAETAKRRDLPSNGAAMAECFKVLHQAHAGKLSICRVWSGTIGEGQSLGGQRVGSLFRPFGQRLDKVAEARAGEIVAIAKMEALSSGQSLSGAGISPVADFPIPEPPVFALALAARNRNDEVKLSGALQKIVEEDPSLAYEQRAETHELLLKGQGETHLKVAIDKLAGRYNIAVDTHPPRVAYRETIQAGATQHARYKRQTGGHGQFGDIKIEIRPLPRGSGFRFVDKIVGGVVPRNFIPAVEEGLRDYLKEGPLGQPVVDLEVTLVDGQYHSVDSSEMSFKMAARIAMTEAMPKCKPVLLEPILKVTVAAPSDATSRIQRLISGRRGQLLGYDARTGWNGWDEVSALMPEAEVADMIVEIRSVTQGVGTWHATFDHLQELVGRTADRIVEETKKRAAA
ncbi:elongation factor G [Enhydrobacter sp.]|jgi:elongation factor G|uniref:elongation factor G n=1 Tax=Enhydrobacter sp. TaxID=1894999 RepID=UPI0026353265|nr:elongation factor G [Enhydrobacter sp.]WIM12787.1 MAG: elongation factor G-like protein [Enhydrobacter sp.]